MSTAASVPCSQLPSVTRANSSRCRSSIASSSRSIWWAASTSRAAMTDPGLLDDPLGHLAHLQDRRAQLGRHGGCRVAQPRDLGHVPGQVAHPLDVAAHPHARDDDAQVGRHRLLAGQQVERHQVELGPARVDLGVGGDHRVGEVDVGVEQGRRGPAHRRRREVGHLDQRLGDAVELLVEGLAHHGVSSGGSVRGQVGRDGPPTALWHPGMNPRRPRGELLAEAPLAGPRRARGPRPRATYPDLVDPTLAAMLGGAVGLVIGAVAVAATRWSERSGAARRAARSRRCPGASATCSRCCARSPWSSTRATPSSTPRRPRSATGWCATASWCTTSCATSRARCAATA